MTSAMTIPGVTFEGNAALSAACWVLAVKMLGFQYGSSALVALDAALESKHGVFVEASSETRAIPGDEREFRRVRIEVPQGGLTAETRDLLLAGGFRKEGPLYCASVLVDLDG